MREGFGWITLINVWGYLQPVIQFSICSFQSAARRPTERRQLTCLLSKATASVNLNSDVYWWPSALYLPLCIFEYCVLSYTVYNIHHWSFITSSISNWQLKMWLIRTTLYLLVPKNMQLRNSVTVTPQIIPKSFCCIARLSHPVTNELFFKLACAKKQEICATKKTIQNK